MQFAFRVHPALDDLDAVEIGTDLVLHGRHEEGRRLARRGLAEVATHGHALPVPDPGRRARLEIVLVEVPAPEEAHEHPGAGAAVDFPPLHGIEQRSPRIVRGPHRDVTGRECLPAHDLGVAELGERVRHARRARLGPGVLAEEVVLVGGRERRVAVRRTDHPELEGIGAELTLELQSQLERAARVLVLQHGVGLQFAEVQVALVPGAIVRELVVGRELAVGLAVTLDLGDLVQRFPACACLRVQLRKRLLGDRVDLGEHQPVRQVAVVRNGEHLSSGLVLIGLQQFPQILGIRAAGGRISRGGYGLAGLVGAITVDHDAVEVLARRDL